MDIDPRDIDDYGTYTPPTTPADTSIMVEDLTQPSNIGDFQITGAQPLEDQTGIIKDAVDPQPVRTILGPDGITYDAVTGQPIVDDPTTRLPQLGSVTEEDLADNTSLLQKLGLPADFDLKQAALEAGINLAVGVPISLIAKGLEAVLPGGIQNTTNVARETGLLTGDNTVTQDIYGINTQSQFGNYDQYNINRVDELEKIVADQTSRGLENTIQMRELTDRKKYLDAKGLTGVGDVDSGRGSGLRPTADDTSTPFVADTFDDDVTLTSTPPTGTITPLEDDFESLVEPIEPPMTLADDNINKMTDDVDLDLFDTTPVDTTVTGTLGPPSEISGPQITEEKPVDTKLADDRAVDELSPDQIIEYENLTNKLEGEEIQKTGNPDISISKQEEIKNKAIDQIKEQDLDEFSDEAFMVGDTSTAAPTTGDSGADSFFDAVDKSVTGTTKPGTKTEPTYQDAIMRGQTGGGSDSGGSSNGGGKIVCTMMNESYGFGSFRNKIWMKFHKDLSPEYQRGYHKLFLPLVKIAKKNMVVKKILEHIAVHSTIDMRQSMRGKTHLLGRIYRKILLPLCYWVGKNG